MASEVFLKTTKRAVDMIFGTNFVSLRGLHSRQIMPELWKKFRQNHCPGLAAELGFWFLYSLFPFLVFLVAASSLLPFAQRHDKILNVLKGFLPPSVFDLIAPTVQQVLIQPNGWLAVGTLLLALWAASTAVSSLMGTLNRVYEVQETRPYWKTKSIALLLTGSMVFIYILAFTTFVIGPILNRLILQHMVGDHTIHLLFKVSRIGIGLLTMMAVLSLIYAFAPNTGGRRRVVVPGAVVVTLGWFGASSAFSFYLENFADYNRFYGALGAVIALMTWLYLVGLLILVGGLVNIEMKHILFPEPTNPRTEMDQRREELVSRS